MRKNLQFVISFKKANSTLRKQKQYKQAQDLWKIVKHDQSLYEQIVKEKLGRKIGVLLLK